jgi:hypothetical protein
MKPNGTLHQDMAASEAEALLEDWPEWKHDARRGAIKARNLLAVWGRLLRFPPGPEDLTGQIERLAKQDCTLLTARFFEGTALSSWSERAGDLSRAESYALDVSSIEALDFAASGLFDELDRSSVALCMARRLLGADADISPSAQSLAKHVEQAETFLDEHPEVFRPVAPLASDLLLTFRPDLDEFDEPLWRTTVKHRALEEMLEEQEAGLRVVRLGAQDLRDILAARGPRLATVEWALEPGRGTADELHLQMALEKNGASAGQPAELASSETTLSSNSLVWHSGSPEWAGQRPSSVELSWYADGRLHVAPGGFLRTGPDRRLRVVWVSRAGRVLASADVAGTDPITLGPCPNEPTPRPPLPGDRLRLRHTGKHASGETWDVSATIEVVLPRNG